jgi:hypothetical protein
MNSTLRWIAQHGERLLFTGLGLVFSSFSIIRLWQGDITAASASFGMGFLSFIYANVARFKKFKGLGFEAELWEDKKKEAEHLIERLKEVVSIYTREIVLSKVKDGRWSDGGNWHERWKLYDDLVQQHNTLGQKISFSSLKKEVDDYFLFDMVMPQWEKCRKALNASNSKAHEAINTRFGSPIEDSVGYGAELEKLRAINIVIEDPLSISRGENLAEHVLNLVIEAKDGFKSAFGVPLEIDTAMLDRLAAISKLYNDRPVKVTDELIAWADRSNYDPH